MSENLQLKTLEVSMATLHQVREVRRQLDAMARRRSRGWISQLPWLKALPYVAAAILLLTGHMTLENLKDWMGVPRR